MENNILNSTKNEPFKVWYSATNEKNEEIKREHIVLFNVPFTKRTETNVFDFSDKILYSFDRIGLSFDELNVGKKVGFTWEKQVHYYDLLNPENIQRMADFSKPKPLIFSESDDINRIYHKTAYIYWIVGNIKPDFIGATTKIVYMGLGMVK